MPLAPKPGFDWSKVVWGGPNDRRTTRCSYCRAELTEDSPPLLILSSQIGSVIEFCSACSSTWWGFESLMDEETSS